MDDLTIEKQGIPRLQFHLLMTRMNRIARVGCDTETVIRVADRLYGEYEERNMLALLNWDGDERWQTT
jgi:hypothetical protein